LQQQPHFAPAFFAAFFGAAFLATFFAALATFLTAFFATFLATVHTPKKVRAARLRETRNRPKIATANLHEKTCVTFTVKTIRESFRSVLRNFRTTTDRLQTSPPDEVSPSARLVATTVLICTDYFLNFNSISTFFPQNSKIILTNSFFAPSQYKFSIINVGQVSNLST
jgi:hypothetical protein